MVRIINIDTKARTIRVSNGKDDLEWFTTDTGSHVPLKKGQSKAEAIKEHFGDGRSSGKKRLDELNKKYGTNKGYLIQSDRPLDKKKDGIIKEYEDFGKATPEVSLTETGSGFHERTKTTSKQKISRDDVIDKSGGANETLDQMLTTGGLTKYERYRMDKMMEHHDIKPEDIIAVLESGEYTPEQVLETLNNYDNEEAIFHMLDVAKAKQQPAKKETKSEDPRKANDGTNEKFHSMFEKFVPDSGPAETLFGEMLRAAARVKYRLFNDGDMYGHGYGKETVNNAMSYLGKLASDNDTEFKKELGRAVYQAVHAASQYDEEEYTKQVNRIYDAFADAKWDDIQNLIDVKNNTDSLDEYPDDTSFDDDEEDEEW